MGLRKREYAVAFHINDSDSFKIADIDKKEWTIIENPRFGWCADPFLYEHKGEYYIFAEMYMYARGMGGIGYCKQYGNGFSKWKLVIKEPYHLSYPNIFEQGGEVYICPESGMSDEIYLYRCVGFPDKWVKDKVLFSGCNCADTTFMPDTVNNDIFEYGITWKGVSEGLYFLKLDNGKIVIRDDGMVTKDNTYARPAGNFCFEDGVLYRPGQIGEPNYGAGLAIVQCSMDSGIYKEKAIERLYADKFRFNKNPGKITGVHTYNRLGRYEVIDLQFDKFEAVSRLARIVGGFNRKRKLSKKYGEKNNGKIINNFNCGVQHGKIYR